MPTLETLAFKKMRQQLSMLHHAFCANPPWTNVPKIHHKTSDPKVFISHISVLNFAGTALHVTPRVFVPTHPEPTPQRYTTKPQTLRLSSHTSLFWTLPEQLSMLHHAFCANPSWTNVPKIHHKTSDPKVFISHIPVLNFAGTALHVTPRVLCQPTLNQRPKDTPQNLRP